MIKLLVANGCSNTRGVELDYPAIHAWPYVLGKLIGIDSVNLACGGGSNRRMVRTTVSSLSNICRDGSLTPEEILIMCIWTHTARHEYYEPTTKELPVRDRPDLPDELHWHRLVPGFIDDGHKPSIAFYENLWNPEGMLANFFLDWAMLDGLLQKDGYVARYGFAWDVIPARIPKQAKSFAKLINPETVYGGVPPKKNCTLLGVTHRHAHGPGGHPLEEGHAFFAEALANWLISDAKIKLKNSI